MKSIKKFGINNQAINDVKNFVDLGIIVSTTDGAEKDVQPRINKVQHVSR